MPSVIEPIIDPDLPIVDAHHHVRDRTGERYLFTELAADLRSGHDVSATVAVECGDMYRAYGPVERRPVGETEFLAGVAAMFGSGRYGPVATCAGIVGYADLRLGSGVAPVIDALTAASGGRLCGIRNPVAWHEAEALRTTRVGSSGLMRDARFREGAAFLAHRSLPLDLWLYHPQLADLFALALNCPDTTFVLNHVGGPIASGPFEGRRAEVFADWKRLLLQVATLPNVTCKLGGLGLPIMGFGFDRQTARPTSEDLASAWQPYIETAIEAFGVERCMFESNYPSDQPSARYATIWNAFKRLTKAFAPAERTALFSATAIRVYGLADRLAEMDETFASRPRG